MPSLFPRLSAVLVHTLLMGALAVAGALAGCSGDGGTTAGTKSDPDGGASAEVADDGWFKPTKKVAGPCSTAFINGKGKVYEDYLRYEYDNKGRKTKAFTWEDVKKHTFTHTWSWDAKGLLAAETFETSGPEPNFDVTYQRDAAGRVTKKAGTMSGYTSIDCVYEYKAVGEKLSLEMCARTWETKDQEGNVTGTDSDKYLVVYTHGPNMITEEHGPLNMSSPDKTIWKHFDGQGHLLKVEVDYSTRGYAEESTHYTYDAAGMLATVRWDQQADGAFESTETHSWDAHGNPTRVDFTQAPTFPASTWDPAELKSTPHGLRHRYECWKGK